MTLFSARNVPRLPFSVNGIYGENMNRIRLQVEVFRTRIK
jgi:hypothetical protein